MTSSRKLRDCDAQAHLLPHVLLFPIRKIRCNKISNCKIKTMKGSKDRHGKPEETAENVCTTNYNTQIQLINIRKQANEPLK